MVSQNPDEASPLELGVDPGWIDAEERVPKHRHGRLELIDDVIDQNRRERCGSARLDLDAFHPQRSGGRPNEDHVAAPDTGLCA